MSRTRPTFTLKLGKHLDSPEGKRYYNEQLFTEVAPRYDFVTRALSLGRDHAWKRWLIRMLPEDPAAPCCVDLACGTGDITRMLAARYPAGRIRGLDLTPSMLEISRRRDSEGLATYQQADMCHTEWDAHSVDIVTGGYALRNAPDLDVLFAELRRILKPGGYAAFLDFSNSPSPRVQRMTYGLLKFWGGFWGLLLHRNPEVYGYIAESLKTFPDREQLAQQLASHGFTVVRRKRFFLGLMELIYCTRTS